MCIVLLVATSVSAAKNRTLEDDLAKERVLSLEGLGKGRELVNISLSGFQFELGKPVMTHKASLNCEDIGALGGNEVKRINRRLSWLNSFRGLSQIEGQMAVSYDLKEPMWAAPCLLFEVEAIKLKQRDGSIKFFAIRPATCISLSTFDANLSKILDHKPGVHGRNEFINPRDIDWFFGVKDFSTYHHD